MSAIAVMQPYFLPYLGYFQLMAGVGVDDKPFSLAVVIFVDDKVIIGFDKRKIEQALGL